MVQKKFQQYKTIPFVVCNYWHTIQFSTRFRCEKGTVWFQLYMNRLENSTNGTKQTHTTQIPSWKVQNKPTPHKYWKNLLVVQCGHPSNVCLFQNICHLFHTIMQTFHTLGICFIPKLAFFIPCATFSYHFGIIKNVWYATCLAVVSPGGKVWKMCPRYETSPQRYENKNLKVWIFFYKVWNFCIRVWKKFLRYENKNLKVTVWNWFLRVWKIFWQGMKLMYKKFFFKVWNFCIRVWKKILRYEIFV